MFFIAPTLVLDPVRAEEAWRPLFLADNQVTIGNVTASHTLANFPVTNLANSQTSSFWKGGSIAETTLEVALSSDGTIDAVGIARHNFGTAQIAVTIMGITAEPGAIYETLLELVPGDDAPILAHFSSDHYVGIRVVLGAGDAAPVAAVLYVGKALRLMRGIPPGYIPLFDARETEVLGRFADNGDFLGDIIVSERLASPLTIPDLDGAWYREHMRPFVRSREPFFFAWSPSVHPDECAFAKFTKDRKPAISQSTGEMDISFEMVGLAL